MARKDKISQEQIRETAQGAASEAGKIAKDLADQGKNWATPRVEAAIDWAAPKVDQAWRKSVSAAAPRVADVADRSREAVDVAHDKIVDDVIPRVVAAMEQAAKAAQGGVDGLQKHAGAALAAAETTVSSQTEEAKKKGKVGRTFGWVLVGAAVAGAGVLIWRRTQPVDDPWAEEYWDDAAATDTDKGRHAASVSDAATAAKGVAADSAAKVKDAAGEVAEKAKEAAGTASDKVKDAADSGQAKVEDVADTAQASTEDAADAAQAKADEVQDKPQG